MTKKSPSRLARDAAAAAAGQTPEKFSERLGQEATRHNKIEAYYVANTCWDDVQAMATQCASLLPQYAAIGAAAGDRHIQAALDNPRRFVNNVQVLARDLRSLNEELMTIRNDHVHKTGGATTAEDHMAALAIHERYIAFVERHNSLLTPTFTSLCEDIQNAERKINAHAGNEEYSKGLTEDVKEVLSKVDAHLGHVPASPLTLAQNPDVISDASIVAG